MVAQGDEKFTRATIRFMTSTQRRLAKKHGTPADFAVAVYQCVPGEISMDEARDAVESYNQEWNGFTRKV